MSTEKSIKDQLTAAVGARKDSLKALRGRIADLLEPLPIGVKLSDDQGLVLRVARVYTGASQWANASWGRTIKGRGYLDAQSKLVAEDIADSIWDGNNMHYRKDEATVLHPDDPDTPLYWLSGKDTRALAARLPEAVARYMAECEAERTANVATLTPEGGN